MRTRALLLAVVCGACAARTEAEPPAEEPAEPEAVLVADLEPETAEPEPVAAPEPAALELPSPALERRPSPQRDREVIDIALRSTPAGAIAAVDGRIIGRTPTHWRGYADGREREFTFVLDDHALARYRFVPIKSGVVHGTLRPILENQDAGPP